MKTDSSLASRLTRAFTLQAILITLAALFGVYLTTLLFEDVLIKQALRHEAEYFWKNYDENPNFKLPDTANLTGYFVGDKQVALPGNTASLSEGFHELPNDVGLSIAYVSENNDRRLLLLFDATQVGKLTVIYGLLPLAAALILLYLTMWLAYRISSRAFLPVTWLAKKVNELDPQSPDLTAFEPENLPEEADHEVKVLAAALSSYAKRLDAFVTRERTFTRDASHELRSPLTVIRLATEMLVTQQELQPKAESSVKRIIRSAQDMEELIDVFLLLARESAHDFAINEVCINDVVAEELVRYQSIIDKKPIEVNISESCRLLTNGSDKVHSILIGNLIRNSVNYTDEGSINISINTGKLTVQDSGIGIPKNQINKVFQPYYRGNANSRSGHGIGMAIVKRLSENFNWPIQIDSEEDVGTTITVSYPQSRCENVLD